MSDEDNSDAAEFAEKTRSGKTSGGRISGRREQPRANQDKKDEEGANPERPSQYAFYSGGFMPAHKTTPTLPPGCYDIQSDNRGVFAVPSAPAAGLLLELPEMRSDDVIKLIENFWDSEADYKDGNEFVVGGAAFKAGLMIYGPPGSGKSCTIKIVSKKLVSRGGTVFNACEMAPAVIQDFLSNFSRIEPDRKCIVIFEDIDALVDRHGESGYLAMLDSAQSIDNVLFIATTNYPEKLDPRLYNRPGRFSHVMKIGLPAPATRKAFLKAILKNHRDVEEIVENTDGFTVDHLTALTNSVYREKKPLRTTIDRLRKMFTIPSSREDNKMGINPD